MDRRTAWPSRPRALGRVPPGAGLARAAGILMPLTLAGLALQAAAPPPGDAPGPDPATAICDSTTTLTAIGMDTDSGLVLFAVAGKGGEAGTWIVALAGAAAGEGGAAREAHAYPERSGAHFGGSVGPGPVLAVEPCGPDCLQPVRFDHGAWQPLGDALHLPSASTVAATYDATGAPWLMAHTATAEKTLTKAFSFRYEGHAWKSHGGLEVTALGQPQVAPAPQRRDGVLSGTGLFSASGPPSTWVEGLPGVAPHRRGQLLALSGTDAAYLAADGVAYLSSDAGKSWRRSTWTPWGGGDTTGIWRQGTDYGIDLPFGDHRGELRLVWFDRRSPATERVVLSRLGAGGSWSELAAAPVDVTTRSGEHLPVTQVLLPRGDAWILLSGCAATATGSGLVLRTFEKGRISEPRFVPIVLEPKPPPEPAPPPHP